MTAIPFKLGTFSIAGCPPFAGIVLDERVVAATALAAFCRARGGKLRGAGSVLDILQDWDGNFPVLQEAVAALSDGGADALPFAKLGDLTLHAPVEPRQIICAGANYRQHVIDLATDQAGPATQHLSREERRAQTAAMMDERIAKGQPYAFAKLLSAVTGPNDPIILPRDVAQPDWELELAVVVGRPARHVDRAAALDFVAGYTIANDISARDRIYRADMKAIGTDWLAGKCAPSFMPMGPFLVPAAFVPDPQDLRITLTLNGEVMQDESTSDMMFGVARLIEYVSARIQLWPGDVISTGSPAGNGTHYNRFLRPGDLLEGTITGLGTLRNRCVTDRTQP